MSYANGGSPTEVLRRFTLDVPRGQFVTFFGPNGCGKTTLLNSIAGLTLPQSGEVNIRGSSEARNRIGYVFQDYRDSLLPWRTNVENVAFPLEINRVPRRQREHTAKELLTRLGCPLRENGYPYELSGGQQQLLAIAQALVNEPQVLLLDEPFNGLDYDTRLRMHEALLAIWAQTAVTTLFVSHDIEEAVYLADRLVLLTKRPARIAKLLDIGLPRPRTPELLGKPEFFELKTEALHVFQRALAE